ncbi:MAG: hypothetical protein Alpg2KO_21460 [Alphaproteobacteria bacterium]
MGGGGGSMTGMLSGRGQANLLTRTTALLAICFFATTLALAVLAKNTTQTITLEDTINQRIELQEGADAETEGAAPAEAPDDAGAEAAPAVPDEASEGATEAPAVPVE